MKQQYSELGQAENDDVEKNGQVSLHQQEDETEDVSILLSHDDTRPMSYECFFVGLIVLLALALPSRQLFWLSSNSFDSATTESSTDVSYHATLDPSKAPTSAGSMYSSPSSAPTALPTLAPKPAWLDFEIPPYDGPSSLQETAEQCARQPGLCYSYVCRGSGIGGQTMTFLTDMLYMQKVYNRTRFILDESHYRKYRSATGTRFMLTYFTPRMAVLDNAEDSHLLDKLIPGDRTYDYWSSVPRDELFAPESHLAVARHPGQHKNLLRYYSAQNGLTWNDLYQDAVHIVCPNMQFNNQTWSRISSLRQQFSFPNYLDLPSTAPAVLVENATNVNETMSVGSISFHIRRTDKVSTGKSRFYPASDYLDQAWKIQERDQIKLTHCFVATDDFRVINELRHALEKYNDDSLCQYLHYTPLSGHGENRVSQDGALIFLTEISVLVETNYFVGTFNSNVADLVALLRACPNLPHDGTKHYAESYAVDTEDWYYNPGRITDHGP